ncbi:MAG TPA: CocE/NonD family hydrolase, partial [Gemmatimonadales bacterium]|nr:CocE/NonD family hydrolase [Gemmatimonadales bacterium]
IGVIHRNVAVPMRDAVVLRADVWLPSVSGRFPTLVYRTPYSKAPVFTTYSLFGAAVARGYAVVAQDVRGRYASDGAYRAYQQEGKDGYDTIEWAAAQPWSNGSVGTFGLSYPGAVQWLAAIESPPHLKAMVPAMTFASPTHFWYTGGVWDNSWISWIWNNIAPDLRKRAGLPGAKTAAEARDTWAREGRALQSALPLGKMEAFRGLAEWYYDWMTHPAYDPWWDWAELTNKYDRVSAAVLNLSGWHDEAYGPAGATTNFAGLVRSRGGNSATARTHLVVGPWTHGIGPISRTRSGERDMGAAAALDYDELVLRWMDRWVKDTDNEVDREPPVRVYAMGAGEWRTGDSWPLKGVEQVSLYLGGQAGGRAGGQVSPSSTFVSNPADPVRDPYAEQAGAHDYRSLSERDDVLVFETEPLTSDLEVVGPISAELYVSVDQVDTDLWVKLLDVSPDGTAYNLMSPGLDVLRASYREMKPKRALLEKDKVYKLELPNLLTGNRFKAGHRLRIAVMASFMPHMSRNLHTGLLEMESDKSVPARITIWHSPERQSRILLSVLDGQAGGRSGGR